MVLMLGKGTCLERSREEVGRWPCLSSATLGWAERQLPGRAIYPGEWLTDNIAPSLWGLSSLHENWYPVEAQRPSVPATAPCGLCISGRIRFGVRRGTLNCPQVKEQPQGEDQMFFKNHLQYFFGILKNFLYSCYCSWMLPAQVLHEKGQASQSRALLLFCLSLWRHNATLPAVIPFKIVVLAVWVFQLYTLKNF